MKPRQDRRPKPVTAESLDRAAAHYLERYSSSRENLRRVLMRRVFRAAEQGERGEAAEAGRSLVDAVIARYEAAGLLDDKRYAEHKAARLARGGASRFQIRGKLRQKGVGGDDIDDAVASLEGDAENSELASACALIRKRRLGPYRAAPDRATFRDRDLAAMARAGFRLDLSRKLLRAPDRDTLESWARGEAEPD